MAVNATAAQGAANDGRDDTDQKTLIVAIYLGENCYDTIGQMTIAVCLPVAVTNWVETALWPHKVLVVKSWRELDSLLKKPGVKVVLLDPGLEGSVDLPTIERILHQHRVVHFVGYVSLTYANLTAVAHLSRHGLSHALVHPLSDKGLLVSLVNRLSGYRLAYEFLGALETRLRALPPFLVGTLQDLFERPQRYSGAVDIALEAGLSRKSLYRAFQESGLGTPSRLVTAAKMIRGYVYLSESPESVNSVSKKLGYMHSRIFVAHTTEIFECCPSELRTETNSAEMLTRLMEWFYKPSARSRERASGVDLAKKTGPVSMSC